MNANRGVEGGSFPRHQMLGDLSEVAIDLEVTSVCNATCGFCPREFMPDKKTFISMELIERLAGELRYQPRPTTVVLCGIGEPTLHPQLDRIVRTLSDAGAEVTMTSHGGRMNAQRFEDLIAQGLSSFYFSLNAATPETHQKVMRLKHFDRIVANLQEILELRRRKYPDIPVNVSFVVCDLNHHEVVDFVEFWRPKGVSQIWLHPVNNRAGLLASGMKKSANLETFARIFESDDQVLVDIFKNVEEEDNLCKVARALIFISSDGEMRLCAMDYERVTSYGNLMHKSLQEMHREKLLGYLRGDMNKFCSGCDFCPPGIRGCDLSEKAETHA